MKKKLNSEIEKLRKNNRFFKLVDSVPYNNSKVGNGDSIMFQFTTTDFFGNPTEENQYDKIYRVAKSKCEYDELIGSILEKSKAQMVKYKCG